MENLGTTNVLLIVIATVSVLEALVVAGLGVAGIRAYKRVMTAANDLEARHLAPALARVNAILDDAKIVSDRVKGEAERVDYAIRTTMDRVDETADRVRSNVRAKTSRIVGIVRGARVALEYMMTRAA